jgi:hypothetical protein
MVKPGKSLKVVEAAQKYYGVADSIWTCRQAELKEAQQALERAQTAANKACEERQKALAFLHMVKRRLEVVGIIHNQEQDADPPHVASPCEKSPPPSSTRTLDTESESDDDDDDDEDSAESNSVAAAPTSPIIRRINNHRKYRTLTSASDNSNTNHNSSILSTSMIEWIPMFYDFLVNVPHGENSETVSVTIARLVIQQVEILWPVFTKGERIDMNTADLDLLYTRAIKWELMHRRGRNNTNGWPLRKPFKKMQLYQDYVRINHRQ